MPQPSPEELTAVRKTMTQMCYRNYRDLINPDPNDMIAQICSGLLASKDYQ